MSTSNKRSLSDESEEEYSASSSSASPKKRVSKPSISSENKENESDASSNIVKMKQKDLEKASKEELVGYALALQKLVGKGGAAGGAALSPEKIAEKVRTAKKNLIKGISSQMKWKPSCKTGSAKFSYSATVPTEAVFLQLFGLPSFKGKQTKIGTQTFETLTGRAIQGKVRYHYLSIKGDNVNLKWNANDNEFTVSGSYGK